MQKARRSAVILGFSRAVAFAGWGCRRVVHLVCRRALPGRRFSIFGLALAAARLSLRPACVWAASLSVSRLTCKSRCYSGVDNAVQPA